MRVIHTDIPEVLILEPKVYSDHRGFFLESYQQKTFSSLTGQEIRFIQDNHSGSVKNVLRGVHYQLQHTQGKLVRVIAGAIYDVAVDIRAGSPTFGKYVGVELSAENKRMLWIPQGFAHGFISLREWNEVLYKATDVYAPTFERSILWNDPAIGIPWPLASSAPPVVSQKDAAGSLLKDAEVFTYSVDENVMLV